MALPEVDGVPVVPFDAFYAGWAWEQGEHVAAVGPTGAGKTWAVLRLLRKRAWVTIVATKPVDRTLSGLKADGYVRIPAWPPPNDRTQRVVLWPKWRSPADDRRQADAVRGCIQAMWREGNWCLFADDVQYLDLRLRLGSDLQAVWLNGRSIGLSLVAATQRPRHVPKEMWANSSHLFVWRSNDGDDIRQLGGMGAADSKRVRAVVGALPRRHCLYINTRTGGLLVLDLNRKVTP